MNKWEVAAVGGTLRLEAKSVYIDQDGTLSFSGEDGKLIAILPRGGWVAAFDMDKVRATGTDK